MPGAVLGPRHHGQQRQLTGPRLLSTRYERVGWVGGSRWPRRSPGYAKDHEVTLPYQWGSASDQRDCRFCGRIAGGPLIITAVGDQGSLDVSQISWQICVGNQLSDHMVCTTPITGWRMLRVHASLVPGPPPASGRMQRLPAAHSPPRLDPLKGSQRQILTAHPHSPIRPVRTCSTYDFKGAAPAASRRVV